MILQKTLAQIVQIHQFQRLILPRAPKYSFGALPCLRIDLPLQALGADPFEHALHGGVDGSKDFDIIFERTL